jgi:cysteine desulfurase
VAAALRHNTALVTIMHSNNEVGTIQPVRQISRLIHEFNARNGTHVLLHSDAAQSIGKVSAWSFCMRCSVCQ